MNNKALVSVIIIFFNAEKFFPEAVESILAQTYGNWELLLVDDGSADNSMRIAHQYTKQYPDKIRYLEHENHQNRGMSASRNLGIEHAKGKYIAFLDADDVWLPQKLEQQVAILNSQPDAAMIYGRTQIWHSWTGNYEDKKSDYMLELGVPPNTLINHPTLFLLFLEGDVQTPTTCNVLIRRKAIDEVGGFQESFRGMYEDQVFFSKLCLRAPVFVAGECWARYRQHPDSWCSVAEKTGEGEEAWLPYLHWIQAYLIEQNINDPEVWKALRRELRPYHHPTLHRFQSWAWHLIGTIQCKVAKVMQQILPGPLYQHLQNFRKTIVDDVV